MENRRGGRRDEIRGRGTESLIEEIERERGFEFQPDENSRRGGGGFFQKPLMPGGQREREGLDRKADTEK